MKKNGLIFNACKVYCFQPEGYWWKQLLISLGISLIMVLVSWLFGLM